ncbi:MAG TPA: hypothetical protein VFA27_13075 [Vicinamibacterales bacterium]|nr:hypothetical protein [Vicinamibacterales bacterium]
MSETAESVPSTGPVEVSPKAPAKVLRMPACRPDGSDGDAVTAVLRKIQSVRKRPLFAFVSKFVVDDTLEEVHSWKRELRDVGKNGLDILIDSPGGSLTSCYMIARLLARWTDSWEALIPTTAASGATLISLGSSKIVMSELAQLGPIDPQVISKRREKFFAAERQSPLEAFQAVQYLRELSLGSLDACMRFLLDPDRGGVAPHRALESANRFGVELMKPIFEKVDPYDLGAFALDSNLALSYCDRIASPANTAKQTQRAVKTRDLVERYPAHEFAIDIAEARALGFEVSEPSVELDDLFDELRKQLVDVEAYIGLVSDVQEKSA